ncbi:hypothetical protein MIND_00977400 [Mycena indigotica]|uniref:Uncharacterized protein n=1 Tax=Mycena indigotica TaxID=2126181 RepID=A0A8H6W0U2_9AGAR|nr:uncharacterized protein MIND_00977400 [Mycena indigotica]KAF7297438.1 hypothetical protein MIND_00977400 [Mycena indigotica]
MPAVVIVGAGVGGISCAIALKRKLNCEDFVIFEKASDVGGTWRDNIYPGASSDIAIHFYSLSTDLNPDWSSTHGTQADALDYWRKLTTKYSLYPHLTLNTRVVSAVWNGSEYDVAVENLLTGEHSNITAKVVVSAIGILEMPKLPAIPGLASFKGHKFHSARWDTGVDLRGQRVAVIGNGASATQFVPLISEDPSVQITQFCRTPNWLLPPARSKYSDTEKWIFRHVPLALKAYRSMLYIRSELLYVAVFARKSLRDMMTKRVKGYILASSPEEMRGQLIPNYEIGCKRVLFDTDYLKCLHRPNMNLNWNRIQNITEQGLVTKNGEVLEFDVIIFATGFIADKYPVHVVGDKGISVQEYYNSQGGPKAYCGTAIPGFPNFFLLAGPNTTTGHTSVILTEEIQINYILKLVKPILAGLVKTFTVTSRATDAYNELIHARLARSVFVGCVSWYRTANGEGKVSSIFPGPMALYAWWLRRPVWEHYEADGASDRWRSLIWWNTLAQMLNPLHYVGLMFGWFLTWVSG